MRAMRACLALVAVAGAALVPASGSQGAGETPVEVISLPALRPDSTGAVLLRAGVRYHLLVSGYRTESADCCGSFSTDAVWTFQDSDPTRAKWGHALRFGFQAPGAPTDCCYGLDTFGEGKGANHWPSYDPGHHYETHFSPKVDARLFIQGTGDAQAGFTNGGPGFVVSIYREAESTTPPPACVRPTRASAHAAVIPSPFQVLYGRGYGEFSCFEDWLKAKLAVSESPPLGRLEKVNVTIDGVTNADLVTVARYVSSVRAAPRGQLRANCLAAARVDIRALVHSHASRAAVATGIQRSILDAVSCLAVAEEIDAYIASHPGGQKARTPTCALTPFGVTLQRRHRQPTEVRTTGVESGPTAPLAVTCVLSQGRIALAVRSRQRGVPLSRFLGPRLAIGLVRSRRDQPGGQVAVRFDRP